MDNAFSKGTPEVQPCIVKLSRATERRHNVEAYVAAILLFRVNHGVKDDEGP